MPLTVNLSGPSPWGFRIFGGRDFQRAITVSKVNEGSKAEKADLQPGDIILEINGESTAYMLNVEAQNKIRNSKTHLQLVVESIFELHRSSVPDRVSSSSLSGQTTVYHFRPKSPSPEQSNGISPPERLRACFQEAVLVTPDENQNYTEYTFSSSASLCPATCLPDSPGSPDRGRDGLTLTMNNVELPSWSLEELGARPSRLSQERFPADFRQNSVSSRTPTPPERYSPHSPLDRDVPTSPRCSSSSTDFVMQKFDKDSEVYKMIQENKEYRTSPRQSNTFKMLQEVLEADEKEAALRFPGKLSPNSPKPSTSVGGVSKYHTCEKCGTNIVTQAVRIMDDRFRHPECYTCTACGLNLRMRGHFWVGDVMYCEKHAKERYQGPGTSH